MSVVDLSLVGTASLFSADYAVPMHACEKNSAIRVAHARISALVCSIA